MASRVSSQKAQSWKAIKAKKKTIRNPETINPCDTYLFVGSGLHIVGAISWSSISLKTSCSRWEEWMWTGNVFPHACVQAMPDCPLVGKVDSF